MIPSLPRRFSASALLRSFPSSTPITALTHKPQHPFLTYPTITMSRQLTFYDPHSSTEVLPPSSISTTTNPTTHTWPPHTRRITFTCHALPYSVWLGERQQAEWGDWRLDRKNDYALEGDPKAWTVIQVRRATARGGGGGGGEMETLEGEVAEQLIEQAGAAAALKAFTPIERGPLTLDNLWLRSNQWWTHPYYSRFLPRYKFEFWLGEHELIRLDGNLEVGGEEEEIACWWIQSTMAKKRHGGEWWKELIRRTRREIRMCEKREGGTREVGPLRSF